MNQKSLVDGRVAVISLLAMGVAFAAAWIAKFLVFLIAFVTNVSFYGKFSGGPVSPAGNSLGLWCIFIPVAGGLIVGLMARYGSKAIRGHGIPEAMEQILMNESRVPARILFLKPLSAAISIGTGGPFGAEGPIIATGGALGSLVGQWIKTSPVERKTLLAAGAAAGMTATFGTPVSAVLLAVELLLFEWKPRSLIPVSLAAATAASARLAMGEQKPFFAMSDLVQPGGGAMIFYILMGVVIGACAIAVTKIVYAVEDGFEDHVPAHWMWWPAIGGLFVGVIGYFSPRTFGVGYTNIEDILSGYWPLMPMLIFCWFKFSSWVISLSSGTSGGTLAPLMTVGGALGVAIGFLGQHLFPGLGIDLRIAGLVGMSGLFSGCSRTLLASVIFGFEATRQPLGLLPMLGGCSMSYMVSCWAIKNSIMTEKIVRRGVHVPVEYAADFSKELSRA